jgi:glycosyltransferase involved in cell wall biosynthesis
MAAAVPDPRPELSVVITCYREERTIGAFHRRLRDTLVELGRPFEIVYVDDGSDDTTAQHLHRIFEEDEHVAAVVELFRNSGQTAAVTAGCAETVGRRLVFLDSDLQLDPEDLPSLVKASDEGADLVAGFRAERADTALRSLFSRLGNAALRTLAGSRLRDLGCTFRIVDARLVRAFEFGPRKVIRMGDLVAAAGRVAEVPVRHHPRAHGRSGWSAAGLLAYGADNLVVLSRRPFQVLSIACFVLGGLVVARLAVGLIWPGGVLDEVTNGLILNVLALGLVVLLGVSAAIGEYVIRSFLALQGAPAYVVRAVRRRDATGGVR